MGDITVNITTSKGDEYRVRLSPQGDRFLSHEAIGMVNEAEISLYAVELERVKGDKPTGHAVLAKIEEVIATAFLERSNAIICFICDFLSPIPSTKKKIPAQEYRSLLFTRMFERYLAQHEVGSVIQSVLTISGIAEDYYIHVIAREKHVKYVNLIGEDIRTGYSK